MATVSRCLFLLLLSTCVALLLWAPLGACEAKLEPIYPGVDATPEQMARYSAQLRRYINLVTRPRFGKRGQENVMDFLGWGLPHTAVPREPGPEDL